MPLFILPTPIPHELGWIIYLFIILMQGVKPIFKFHLRCIFLKIVTVQYISKATMHPNFTIYERQYKMNIKAASV